MGIVVIVAGIYLVVLLLLWTMQERLSFPAPRAALPDPVRMLGYGERVELRMKDGTQLVGWYLAPSAASPRRAVAALLWFYGNGETIAAIWPILRDFRPPDASLLVVDYPGYGASGGRTTETGIYEAADLAYRELQRRPEVDPRRIYVYGRSLGSAVATHTASTHEVAGMILESPFTSARAMARRLYRIFPSALVRLKLDNLGTIPNVHCRTLIFHGSADGLVPIEMGREVASRAGGPAEFVVLEGADHNDTYDAGRTIYREKVAAFVK